MKTIRDLDIEEKRTLIRVDFNVPLDENGHITDDTRIRRSLKTIERALEKKAKIILASHMGRPGGKPDPALSLSPAAARLGELLGETVRLAPLQDMAAGVGEGEIVLLENLRFHPGEEENSDDFGRSLAGLCDVYINEAFSVSHRQNASVCAVARHAPETGAGFLLESELLWHERAFQSPARPLAAVIGGAKISGKIEALKNLADIVDILIIGGAMANTFLKSAGIGVGKSLFEEKRLDMARAVMESARERGPELLIPVDVAASGTLEAGAEREVFAAGEIPEDQMALDIGPETSAIFAKALGRARTIVWNGPMGAFEYPPFDRGTMDMARSVAESGAFSAAGGGDTVAAVNRAGAADKISHISTGGGAFLALLEGKTLPGVAALH
ncbi:Phosphoglycerate kinase [Candidatus Desulfarcum epimagneticum]|uniref:Phosphoglycerate kinase n=1 Tax=uncultured Desulfobacteraceae bacterium TaxID=218296 RepID=A0A484HQM7_9BACT|nr:Phosphoglycerate kinase [uncultured Desulfobacteraceae bacterium]